MEISRTLWLPDITGWWWHQEDPQTQYFNIHNVVLDIYSSILHDIGVKASFYVARELSGWSQSKTMSMILWESNVDRLLGQANNQIFVGDSATFPTI
jgi:hypothetical protein